MVILFLVILWAIVLAPSLLRSRSTGRLGDSIGAFQRHLGNLRGSSREPEEIQRPVSLQRAVVAQLPPPASSVSVVRIVRDEESGPAAPALTLASDPMPTSGPRFIDAEADGLIDPGTGGSEAFHSGPTDSGRGVSRTVQDSLDGVRSDGYLFDDFEGGGDPRLEAFPGTYQPPRVPQMTTRQMTLKRRRDVLMFLFGGFAVCMVLGMVSALRPLWYLGVLLLIGLSGYVALLLKIKRNAIEYQEKVTVLPTKARYVAVGSSSPPVVTYIDNEEPVVVVSAAGGGF